MLKRIILYFLIILSSYQIDVFSQEIEKKDSSNESYTHEIQFYIINEIIAAYKYKFNDVSSLRLTFNVTGLLDDQNADKIEYRESTTDTPLGTEKQESTYSNHFFELKIQYLHSVQFEDIVQFYFGGGPFVNYNFIQNESSYEIYDTRTQEIRKGYGKSNSNIWRLGFSAVIGLELVVYKNINVFAEYEAIIQKGWRSIDQYSNNNSYVDNDDYELNGYYLKGIRIGFGICF